MSTTTSDPTEPTVHHFAPRVLAMPSPTAVRSIFLVGTLLSAGLFVGTWFHNATAVGDSWLRRFAQCWSSTSSTATTDIQANLLQVQAYDACVASAQTTLAFFAVGGVAVAALLGLVVSLAVPRVLERRRQLRAGGGAVAIATPRLRELATDLGMRRMPRVAVGPSTVRDAFTYGRPGRYSVVLPTGVAIRPGDASTFDPLVRHEPAHIRRRDVELAWGARSFWLALLPILVAPVVWATATSDLSLLPVYVWRAAVLVAVTGLAAPAILRGREFEADLASSDTPEHREALAALLARLREREAAMVAWAARQPSRPRRSARSHRRPVAHHPPDRPGRPDRGLPRRARGTPPRVARVDRPVRGRDRGRREHAARRIGAGRDPGSRSVASFDRVLGSRGRRRPDRVGPSGRAAYRAGHLRRVRVGRGGVARPGRCEHGHGPLPAVGRPPPRPGGGGRRGRRCVAG